LLLAAAQACGLSGGSAEECAEGLQDWSARRESEISGLSVAQQEWAELQALLDGGSLPGLEDAARTAEEQAARLAAMVAPTLLASVDDGSAELRLPGLREKAQDAANQAANAEGELRLFATGIASVAEAEEALHTAEVELARVRALDETLKLTCRFLEVAQTRVHRDIAPVLAHTVRQWLPQLTGGRYTDVAVDPTTLKVEVCGPSRHWRRAELLSYGTAEQIYLLLRVALADHLTRGRDTCPLILDDVTVHADSSRTRDVLELLLKVSQDRQVVLFTQENEVADWARVKLAPPYHAIRELVPVATV
jgi:DNA repair exonuclease SbcCD ATPase subunit